MLGKLIYLPFEVSKSLGTITSADPSYCNFKPEYIVDSELSNVLSQNRNSYSLSKTEEVFK